MEGQEHWEIRRQVAETDPVYQAERKRMQGAYRSDVFGASAVRIYEDNVETEARLLSEKGKLEVELELAQGKDEQQAQRLKEDIQWKSDIAESVRKEKARFLRTNFVLLMDNVEQLLAKEGYEERKKYILAETERMFGSEENRSELRLHFGDDFAGFTASNFSSKVTDGSISDELLYVAAKRHVENIREQEVQLEGIVEETKDEFRIAIEQGVADGWLPQSAAQSLSRLDDVQVTLLDRMLRIDSGVTGESDSGRIRVTNDQLHPDLISRLKKTLTHEFLHEISGKSITVRTRIDDSPHQIHHAYHKKSGVALHDDNLWYSPNKWLNEAITEWLSLRLSGYDGDAGEAAYKGSHSYPEERQELDRLFERGLEEQVVTEAYFENFTSEQAKGEKGKHFAKLIRRINEIEGPAGFARLENEHVMNEIDSVMHNLYVYPEGILPAIREHMPDARVFEVAVTVGTSEQTSVVRKFVYAARPLKMGGTEISALDRWARVEKDLSVVKGTYNGKVKLATAEI